MEQYPIVGANGLKLVKEDLEDSWKLAGTVGDKVLAQLAQVPTSAGDRSGWLVPVEDGPVIQPNGATGTVLVKPFTAYRGPITAETSRGLMSAFFAGSVETVPTPLPTAGNHNWYLLYAIVAETDAQAESRMVEDPTTEVVAAQTLNTVHKSTVTLAWVQGAVAPTATDPYPAGDFPALPVPAAGQAHVIIGYVHVHTSATPATVTYGVDVLYNAPHLAKVNPQTGAESVSLAAFGRVSGTPGNMVALTDVKALATTAGTGINNPAGKRPAAFFEPVSGGRKIWIPLSFGGATVIGTAWTVLGGTGGAIITPDTAKDIHGHNPVDLLNRMFVGELRVSHGGSAWAHDQDSTAADCVWPTTMPRVAGPTNANPPVKGMGNTIRGNAEFDTESALGAGSWYLACMFRAALGDGDDGNNIALLVRRVTSGGYTAGAMHVAATEGLAGKLDGKLGMIILEASPIGFKFGF